MARIGVPMLVGIGLTCMRLRTIMTIVFCLSALAPMLLFWIWPNSNLLRNERQTVQEHHLLLSKSIAAELSAYHGQLIETFSIFARQFATLGSFKPEPSFIERLDILNVCAANLDTGIVNKSFNRGDVKCPRRFGQKMLDTIRANLETSAGNSVVTPVATLPTGLEVLYLLYGNQKSFVIGTVSTDYVTTVGMRNRFGEAGHVTILDSNGHIIFHPNKTPEMKLEALGGQKQIDRAISGANGTGSYYSPLFQEDLISGYSHTGEAGWSVFVSQPIVELESKVEEMKYSSLSVMGIGLLVAILMAFIATKLLTFPIVQMVQVMERIGNGQLRAYENIQDGRFQPLEFHKARDSIRAMAEKLRENIDTISQHAYLDGITGLPNRECFKVLAQEEIEKLNLAGQKGGLLFLDLDGFKQVNDVYGHRSGDDLLQGFANKIHVYCGNEMKRRASGAENAINILPARLGGDEFVIFLGNVRNTEMVREFADGLFRRVFGNFSLHNGIVLKVNGSVGGAIFPDHGSDFDELLRLADIAMYQAKNSGKGKFCLHQSIDEFSASEASLAYEIESDPAG